MAPDDLNTAETICSAAYAPVENWRAAPLPCMVPDTLSLGPLNAVEPLEQVTSIHIQADSR